MTDRVWKVFFPSFFSTPVNFPKEEFWFNHSFYEKVDDSRNRKKENNDGNSGHYNILASQLPEWWPTATPTALANNTEMLDILQQYKMLYIKSKCTPYLSTMFSHITTLQYIVWQFRMFVQHFKIMYICQDTLFILYIAVQYCKIS